MKTFKNMGELCKALVDGNKITNVGWLPEYYIFLNKDGELENNDGSKTSRNFNDPAQWGLWATEEDKKKLEPEPLKLTKKEAVLAALVVGAFLFNQYVESEE